MNTKYLNQNNIFYFKMKLIEHGKDILMINKLHVLVKLETNTII